MNINFILNIKKILLKKQTYLNISTNFRSLLVFFLFKLEAIKKHLSLDSGETFNKNVLHLGEKKNTTLFFKKTNGNILKKTDTILKY